ncbi:hypothetical protein RvY_17465 [Ramazzottius varieornatus]|uniref:F-box domain-containing protein n=1 Tax=Ramazzottius varieornatus TaxID=947166 RepID=A0A1D1W276_RAMVA|nr:hypothetical protein RvY_17465 [Ramazzottius varieornatus]
MSRWQASWQFIEQQADLVSDILSHFNVFFRNRFRRVSKGWNEVLGTPWDGHVNRCLFFDFTGGPDYFPWCPFDMNEVARTVSHVLDTSSTRCGSIPRLMLKFPFSAHQDRCRRSTSYLGDQLLYGKPLIEHCHFSTVMLINMSFFEYGFFEFGQRGARWSRETKIILHNCELYLSDFLFSFEDNEPSLGRYYRLNRERDWTMTVPFLSLAIGPETSFKERRIRLLEALDGQGLVWPFPSEQLQWLSLCWSSYLLNHAPDQLVEMNAQGQYTFYQAVGQFLREYDRDRKLVKTWKPSRVFFDNGELSFRDCLIIACEYEKSAKEGKTRPPYSLSTTFGKAGVAYRDYIRFISVKSSRRSYLVIFF